VVNLARLFNEPSGQAYLVKSGVPKSFVGKLDLLGFSSIANTVMGIKMAKYYELQENDVILTVWTDSMDLYQSRLEEMHQEFGEYTELDAAVHFAHYLEGLTTDHIQELTYADRRRIHNLKYFTWVEQQGKSYQEIMDQWYDRHYWTSFQNQISDIDERIADFNGKVGLITSRP
jgi:hypothetical protein